MSAVDTDVLIIGAGLSGLGLAIQLKRKLGHSNFRIIEKNADIGGTWLVNTYPGCGCDVPSHFYSFSFALNPDWSKLFSMQPEIKSYFQSLATRFDILPNITFNAAVESAVWDQAGLYWRVNAVDQTNKSTYQLTARAVVCAVGSLSIPKSCTIPGAESFSGKLFHSAKWDKSFDWTDRNVVAVGNGCSATQFVPVMTGAVEDETFASGPARQVVQFSRQAHYIIPRTQISYTPSFKWVMRNVPLAMRLYRGLIYVLLEKDFAGFHATRGQKIRDQLAQDNNDYVKSKAPEKYWDYLIPKHQVLCKRKVLDTDYLDCLSRPNMELVPDDPIQHIEPEGIRTKSGRLVPADAIVLATGFEFHRLYFPMRIVGSDGLDLEEHWNKYNSGRPAAYLGTLTPNFPNFFTLMGPNTLTGHSSVIYTSECQILLTLGLLAPILRQSDGPKAVTVTPAAAERDITNTRERLRDYVWSTGCSSWALHPESGENIAMYHHYQWHYYLRCMFLRSRDFQYMQRDGRRRTLIVGFGWVYLRRTFWSIVVMAATAWAVRKRGGWREVLGQGIEAVKGLFA